MIVPGRVQFPGGTDNALRHVQIDRAFSLKGAVPNLGAEVPSCWAKPSASGMAIP